jgi:amino acid transporter
MVGGGIYVALGVVVEASGRWAWLSFLLAGIVAVTTAHAYARLSNHFRSGGGAFEFLEDIDRRGLAGSLSWVLLAAYTLTIGLYAYAFGEYVAHAVGLGATWPRGIAVGVLALLTVLNLAGLGKMKGVEIAIVSGNLLALLALAAVGLIGFWSTGALVAPTGPRPIQDAWMGAAVIFVSYEGFQLLTYEYEEVDRPERILGPGLVGSAVAVVAIYVLVALGATMIAGAEAIIQRKGVALSVAAERAAGPAGLWVLTVAAAFATSAAINSTLFSSGTLARRVANDGELPAWLDHRNDRGVPDRAVVLLSVLAAVLAWVGSLGGLVEAASLVFLAAFGAVHAVAWREKVEARWVSALAGAVGGVILVLLLYRLATTRPVPLVLILLIFAVSFLLRPWLLRHTRTERGH